MNMDERIEIKLEIDKFEVRPCKIFYIVPIDFIFNFSKNFVRYRIKNINNFDIDKTKIRLKQGAHDTIQVTSDPNGYEEMNVYIEIPSLHKGESKEDFKVFFLSGKGQTHLNLYLNSYEIDGNKKIVFTVNKVEEKKYIDNSGNYHKTIKVFYGLELSTFILSILRKFGLIM